jgi:hypothetical protein
MPLRDEMAAVLPQGFSKGEQVARPLFNILSV